MSPTTSHDARLPPKKSTTVRAVPLPLRAVAAGLRAVESWSPGLAAQLGVGLMFRTTRSAPSAAERLVTASGERFDVSSHGKKIAAWSYGEGPTVLLVHGWNGRGSQLGALVDPLLARGFRVVLFDGPGHGASEGTHASLVEMADAVDAMVAAAAPVFSPLQGIVAHSMGCAAVTYAMSRALASPDTSNERALRDELPARRFAFVASPIDIRDFVGGFARFVGLGEVTRGEMVRRIEQKFSVSAEYLYGPTMAEKLDAPLLVMHDADDREVPVRCGELLAAAWPGAELVVTQGLGHVRILRDEAVVQRLVDFVTR